MPLQKELWQQDILENLYPGNDFARVARNGDQYVLNGAVVHVPVSGTAATVKRNLTSFPQTATQRADSEIVYALDTYYALPRHVQKLDQYELSYNKRMSVVGDDVRNLVHNTMSGLLYRWAPPVSNVIDTTGANTTADLINGATGTRKMFTKDEFKLIAKKFDGTDIPGRRVALLTSNHYHQLFESFSDSEKTNFNNVADLTNGVVGRYMGIDIMMRSSVLRYRKVSNVWTPVDTLADSYAPAAGDSAASLFWIEPCVERALGSVETFDDTNNPLYYGDLYSAMIRMGGRIVRLPGVYAVAEAIVA